MYTQLTWKNEYNLGVDIIDKEHRRLFKIINKLFAVVEEDKKSKWACQEGIKYFKEHALKHFAEEENYMASIGYADFEAHKHVHRDFREKTLPSLEQELEMTDYSPDAINHFLGVCAGWLVGHTLTEDRAITDSGKSQIKNLLPEEKLDTLKKTIIELLYDLFNLESHVISESYSGEKFGKGIYYRLIYGTDKEEIWEIILVFEEQLLVNTVGKILGLKTNKVFSMLLNAARHTAQQFIGRLLERFPDSKNHELREENLLTYEQFQKVFQKYTPQVRLLFDTGAGYFSFCAIAPHLLENKVGTAIKEDNAIAEIDEYLKKLEISQANRKPKVLVVDDSLTIRQGMKELLEKDYEIAEAKSGMSAIQSITLDRPDLVLLDYEMPVCDGKQVLEMIRSEETIADIPVFFLTGRVDQESIKRVLSLKPEGYLSKYLKPAEIKTNIDRYFERQKS